MHAVLRSLIQLIVTKCELVLSKGDLNQSETSELENALFYLRKLL